MSVQFMANKRRSFICLAVIIGLSALLDSFVALRMSVTNDEPIHLLYGVRILHFRPDRRTGGYFDSKMPISTLNAFPQRLASFLDRRHRLPQFCAFLGRLGVARIPTILATLALTLLVYLWAYDLYGAGPALASSLLCALSPNLIAHGTLATTDMYHAVGVIGSLYFFRRFLLQPTPPRALLSGFVLAVAQITKPFSLYLYPLVCLFMAIAVFRRAQFRSLSPRRLLAFAAIAVGWFIVINNIAYCFDRPFTRLESYHFQSPPFIRLQRTPLLQRVPVPVPYPFLQGLDMTKYAEDNGWVFGNVYLLGKLGDTRSQSFHGFKSYYAVALFFKEPIALQILFFLGLFWVWKHRSRPDFLLGEGLLLTAAATLVLWLSFFSRAQIGIRHILPALAVEVVIAGAAFSSFSSMPLARKALLATLVVWLAVSVGSYYPHMIPYMNEWVHDRRLSYKILADSNLDWGQDAGVVDEFLKRNPDVILNPPGPVAGRILMGANRLTGVEFWSPSAAWLATRYRPVAQVGYAHFLFVVTATDVARRGP